MEDRGKDSSSFRVADPKLSLTGNIISATFNGPHTLSYRKGGQWVRLES